MRRTQGAECACPARASRETGGVCRPFSLLPIFDVETQRVCPERSAILVIGGVRDVLSVHRDEETFYDTRACNSFPRCTPAHSLAGHRR